MELSDMQRLSIEFDKRCLADLDLEMPRLSAKYLSAVFTLAHLEEVSPYFVHLQAARIGTKTVYNDLRKYGYVWNKQDWVQA